MIYVLSGGGSTTLFAAIGVTYSAGSTLTCTNGTSTLKAKTTTGQWVFAIPKAGTWTVTATDGTNTKTQTVEITAEGQLEEITLVYSITILSTDSGLADGYSLSTYSLLPAIDVTNYSTLTIKGHLTWSSTAAFSMRVGLAASSNSQTLAAETTFAYSDGETTLTIDISGLSGNYYFTAYKQTTSYGWTFSLVDNHLYVANQSNNTYGFKGEIYEIVFS